MRVVVAHHLNCAVTDLRAKKALAAVLSWKKFYPEFDVCFYADPEFWKEYEKIFVSNQIHFYPTAFESYDIPEKVKADTYAWAKVLADSFQTEPFISCDSDAYVSSRFFEEKDLKENTAYTGLFFGEFSEIQKRNPDHVLYRSVTLPPKLQMPGGDFTYYFNPELAKEVLSVVKEIAQTCYADNGLDEVAKAFVFYSHGVPYTTLFPVEGYHHKDEYENSIRLDW